MNKICLLSATLLISACSTTGTISPLTSGAPIHGTVTRGLFEPHQIEVILSGKSYRGEWRTEAAPEHSDAKSLVHKRHVGKVQSALRAVDGGQLICSWLVHSQVGEGSCIGPDKREYALKVQ
ncbi:MAG: hypothetical protein WCV99_06930 [Sterolibacterium sp.]